MILGWLSALPVFGQRALDEYVAQGLASNRQIQQAHFELDKSMLALKEAKALYLPSVNFGANYFLSGGGRTVDFPIGDLLNPVYATLNEMMGSNQFPQLENQSILLNPNNFYDAKVRVSMPIYQAELAYNQRIKAAQVQVKELEVSVFQRELVKDIKSAYFQYLQANEAVKIYASVVELAEENLRINQSLQRNDKVNATTVLRSENEVSKYKAALTAAEQGQYSAQAYFNFLLNRPADSPIETDGSFEAPAGFLTDAQSAAGREELAQLDQAEKIQEQVVHASNAYLRPKVGTFLDLGSQGFNFDVNDKTLYYFFGVSLDWNIFAGNRNKLKAQQAAYDAQILQSRTDYVAEQLTLQLTTSIHSFLAAKAQYEGAQQQLRGSERYYNDFLRLYKEGQALYIELLDAQNQWVTARLQANITLFDLWTKAAEIERANASFSLNP